MDYSKLGTISFGVRMPLIHEGDDVMNMVLDELQHYDLQDHDIIGLTESIVARAQGNYVTVDEIVQELEETIHNKYIVLWQPIMSRNRFSLILRAFARYADKLIILVDEEYDEQGNPTFGVNRFTGVDIQQYYKDICKEENCELFIKTCEWIDLDIHRDYTLIDARCHPDNCEFDFTLMDFLNDPTKNVWSEYGLLGSNKADGERLKLFPHLCFNFCEELHQAIKKQYNKDVEVLVYGDGCFKDPIGGIWEFADPVTCPGYTLGLKGRPNEVKIKYLIDCGKNIEEEIKNKTQDKLDMSKQGTTPRRYIDLLASLMDLTSGSGDKGTPVVIVRNYFKNYAE